MPLDRLIVSCCANPDLPLTVTGKIRRGELRRRDREALQRAHA